MRQAKKKFNHESMQDTKSIKGILKSITKGLSKGTIVLSDEHDDLILEPKGLLTLKVAAVQDSDQSSINLRIQWQTPKIMSKNRKLLVSSK